MSCDTMDINLDDLVSGESLIQYYRKKQPAKQTISGIELARKSIQS